MGFLSQDPIYVSVSLWRNKGGVWLSPEAEKAVCRMAIDRPGFGQLRFPNELKKMAMFFSPAGVRSIWLRPDLETFKKRLKALKAKAAKEN